jgi:glycosyltransferase involved in cell wall biosynthesis
VRPLRIAMIGQRGVPATFGGIEHHVEEIGARLADRGHDVVVYTRTNYVERRVRFFRGMRPRYLPTVSSKHLDAIVHSTLATLDASIRGADVVHYHAVGPGIPAMIPRAFSRAKVVLTVHGLDAERAKWRSGARAVLGLAQWLSARVPDETIVVSKDLQRHYRDRYGRGTTYIPNGVAPPERRPANEIARRFGLHGDDYVLFVGRLVPEKAPDLLVRAFGQVKTDQRLVVAGGSSFTDDYVRSLRSLVATDPRVIMPGYVYGTLLEELYTNASAFVLPSSLEGLPLTVLEAAAYGTPVVVSDIAPNAEVVGADGPGHRLVPVDDEAALAAALRRVLSDPRAERTGAEALRQRVLACFRWEDAVTTTEAVYEQVTADRPGRQRSPEDRRGPGL